MFELRSYKQVAFCLALIALGDIIYYTVINKNQFGRGIVLGALNFNIGMSIFFFFFSRFRILAQIIISLILAVLISFVLTKFNFSSNFILGIFVGFLGILLEGIVKQITKNGRRKLL